MLSLSFKTRDSLTAALHSCMVKNDATHLGQILLESKLLFIPSSELRTKTLVECLVDALVGYNDDHPEDFPNKIRDSILTIHNLNFPEPSPDDPMKVFINRDIHIHKALLFNSLDKQVAEDLIGGLPSSMQSGLNIKHISDEASSPKS